jgi:hypothetical protein
VEPISSHAEHARKCLKVQYLGRIEYDFQKSRVTGPWDHMVLYSAKSQKKIHACVPLTYSFSMHSKVGNNINPFFFLNPSCKVKLKTRLSKAKQVYLQKMITKGCERHLTKHKAHIRKLYYILIKNISIKPGSFNNKNAPQIISQFKRELLCKTLYLLPHGPIKAQSLQMELLSASGFAKGVKSARNNAQF